MLAGLLDDACALVVYERFVPAPGVAARVGRNAVPTIETIGVLKYLCRERGWHPVGYLPSDKGFWTDVKLREAGYWRGGVHERDAIRLGLHHLHFKLGLPWREREPWQTSEHRRLRVVNRRSG